MQVLAGGVIYLQVVVAVDARTATAVLPRGEHLADVQFRQLAGFLAQLGQPQP